MPVCALPNVIRLYSRHSVATHAAMPKPCGFRFRVKNAPMCVVSLTLNPLAMAAEQRLPTPALVLLAAWPPLPTIWRTNPCPEPQQPPHAPLTHCLFGLIGHPQPHNRHLPSAATLPVPSTKRPLSHVSPRRIGVGVRGASPAAHEHAVGAGQDQSEGG